MRRQKNNTNHSAGGLLAGVLLCVLPAISFADQANISTADIINGAQIEAGNQSMLAFTLPDDTVPGNLAFDLGGSDTRNLKLQLSTPLTLNIGSTVQKSPSGVGSVFLQNSLNARLTDKLDITASLGAGKSQSSFQPLGSIHCQNGVLEQGSYRASDCYFINQANILKQDQIAMGLRYSNGGLSTSVGMFRNEASLGQQGVRSQSQPLSGLSMGSGLLAPTQNNPLLPAFTSGQPFNSLSSEVSGLDLEFQVGWTMDSAGALKLGLQLTRILDASYEATSLYSPGLQQWAIADPFDSARINLDWSKGNFSGGIQGFYREQVQFLNRDALDSKTTFDVHFTWRAPWNAMLSVGTTNVLNSGTEDNGKTDSGLQDPFESIYGRIPYVRYKQDL